MNDKCLSCDWDFNENPNDRYETSDTIAAFFCKWCVNADGATGLSFDEARNKLIESGNSSSETMAQLEACGARWKGQSD